LRLRLAMIAAHSCCEKTSVDQRVFTPMELLAV